MIEYIGLVLATLVLIGFFVFFIKVLNYCFQESLKPGGGFFFLVYMFASAFLFLGAEALIVLINYFTGFAAIL